MRFVAKHMKECGPGEVWWILDTSTDRYTSWSLGNGNEARAIASKLETGEMQS